MNFAIQKLLLATVCILLPVNFSYGFNGPPQDDTVWINQQILEAKQHSINHADEFVWVHLPNRNYFVSETIELPANVGLRGNGIDLTTIHTIPGLRTATLELAHSDNAQLKDLQLKPADSQKWVIRISRSENVTLSNVRIRDFHEPDGGVNGHKMFALEVKHDCSGMTIDGCQFINMSMESDRFSESLRAIVFNGDTAAQGVVIRNCLFEQIYAIGGIASARDADAIVIQYKVDITRGPEILIDGNEFINAGKRAVKDQTGGVHIHNNDMTWEDDFYDEFTGLGSVVDPNEAIGLQLQTDPLIYSTIRNNRIYGNFINGAIRIGNNKIKNAQVVNFAIVRDNVIEVPSGNRVVNVRFWPNRDGIQLWEDEANRVDIIDNKFKGTFRWGINKYAHNEVFLSGTEFPGALRGEIHNRD